MKSVFLFLVFFSFASHAFVEEYVQFNVGGGIALKGYLAKPNAAGKFPVLILQAGSGKGTTDNPSRRYNPFADLSRALADQGFVVLRFDKRGTGYNELNGSFADSTFLDYVNDLHAAVAFTQQRADVLRGEIYLLGHSLGGPVINFVANFNPNIKGIILSASPGRSFAEFNLEQMRYIFEMGQKLSGEALEKELKSVERSSSLINQPEQFCTEFPFDCERKDGKIYMWKQSAEFWREISLLAPIAYLKDTTCKIFAIHGTSDWVVSSDNDGGAIAKAMAGNPKFSSVVISGMDHFLIETESKQKSVEFFLKPHENIHIHPEFIPTISNVLKVWRRPAL